MNVSRDNLNLGEKVEGTLVVTAQEEVDVDEIRMELQAFERLKPGGGVIRDVQENQETRLYSPPVENVANAATREYVMFRAQRQVIGPMRVTNGFNQQFSFTIAVPANSGQTFQGMRRDGRWLQRTWVLKAVLAVGGRPDVETKREIYTSIPAQVSVNTPVAVSTVAVGASGPGLQAAEVTVGAAEPGFQNSYCVVVCSLYWAGELVCGFRAPHWKA